MPLLLPDPELDPEPDPPPSLPPDAELAPDAPDPDAPDVVPEPDAEPALEDPELAPWDVAPEFDPELAPLDVVPEFDPEPMLPAPSEPEQPARNATRVNAKLAEWLGTAASSPRKTGADVRAAGRADALFMEGARNFLSLVRHLFAVVSTNTVHMTNGGAGIIGIRPVDRQVGFP